jgi:deazaflavin-dependent oxidoreductase (nitroreductase family)
MDRSVQTVIEVIEVMEIADKPAEGERVPPWISVMNPVMKGMLRLGVPMGPTILLTVRGRKTGRAHTTPVGMFERDGRRWLFAQFGTVGWVRNLRVSGHAVVGRGRRREDVVAVELHAAEAASVLHDVVAPWLKGPMGGMAGVVAGRPIFNVALDAPVEEFIAEARRHPIFEVNPKGGAR